MTLIPVDRDALDRLLQKAWTMFELLAEESGYTQMTLEPESELVTVAVQAGLLIPGPLAPDTVPPAPPPYLGTLTAPTYRAADGRLRCAGCGKVVYATGQAAEHAAGRISERERMKSYLGPCGHWHVSRVKRR